MARSRTCPRCCVAARSSCSSPTKIHRRVDLPLVLLEGLREGLATISIDRGPIRELFSLADAHGREIGARVDPTLGPAGLGQGDPRAASTDPRRCSRCPTTPSACSATASRPREWGRTTRRCIASCWRAGTERAVWLSRRCRLQLWPLRPRLRRFVELGNALISLRSQPANTAEFGGTRLALQSSMRKLLPAAFLLSLALMGLTLLASS